MNAETRLEELLSRWQERHAKGEDVPAAELCPDCPELLPEVERRLLALRQMQQLVTDDLSRATLGAAQPSEAAAPPRALAGYEILGELGRGGMGVVYRARQTGLKRLVALKMILAGPHAGAEQLARFRAEAEAVARLKHPNIIEIHEIGEACGRPYFALEFVEGGTLDKKQAGTPLAPREAAALVATLARAMQHAHGHGIVHRDLKPGNVLLTADGTPKVSDFGLAKRLDVPGQTSVGAVLGTPSYMAPEQARGQAEAIGPRTDVYGLGAILYELLTGRPPFKAATTTDTLMQVMTVEPVPPRRLLPRLSRDLETVCLKCLEKEPHKRYASAHELADDLGRFLDNRPIVARPVAAVARLWRWSGRNRLVAGLSAALVLVVAGGFVGLSVLWLQANAERATAEAERQRAEDNATHARGQQTVAETQSRLAQAEAAKAKKIAEVLTGMFEAADPLGLNGSGLLPTPSGKDLTARDILKQGALLVTKELDKEPEVKAQLLDTLGIVYCTLGLTAEAQPLLEDALAIRRRVPKDAELASTLHNLGWLHHQRGDYAQARGFYEEALALRRPQLASDSRPATTTMLTLAWLLADMEEFAASERMFQDVVDLRLRYLPRDHRDVAVARVGLAAVYLDQGKFQDAIAPGMAAYQALRRADGDQGLAESIMLFQQGFLARELPPLAATFFGGMDGSERKLQKSLELSRQILKDNHAYTGLVHFELARTLERRNNDVKAELHYRECLRIARIYGLEHPKAKALLRHFGSFLQRHDKQSEAEDLLQEAVEACRRRYGETHHRVADTLHAYAELLGNASDRRRREDLLRQALAIYRQTPGTPRRNMCLCLNQLAVCLDKANAAEAERLLEEGLGLALKQFTSDHLFVERVRGNLVWARHEAARAAALAAAGMAKGADSLPEQEKANLRRQALDRLAAELSGRRQLLERDPIAAAVLQPPLEDWLGDANFAGVRDADKLANLSSGEQETWRRLWADVASLAKDTRGTHTTTKQHGKLNSEQREQTHPLAMSAGKTYVIDMESRQFDTYLRLEDDRGKVLKENDDISPGNLNAPENLNSRIVFQPTRDGSCRVIATPFQGRGSGDYALTIRTFVRLR
jgi:tetratricopeptide (TPR) repeat protein